MRLYSGISVELKFCTFEVWFTRGKSASDAREKFVNQPTANRVFRGFNRSRTAVVCEIRTRLWAKIHARVHDLKYVYARPPRRERFSRFIIPRQTTKLEEGSEVIFVRPSARTNAFWKYNCPEFRHAHFLWLWPLYLYLGTASSISQRK